MNAPRLLFLTSEPPQLSGAGSIIFHRLLGDYPPDRMRVITNAALAPSEQRLACPYARLPLLADRLVRTRFWPWRAALRALGAPDLLSRRPIDRLLGKGFEPDLVATLMQDSWFYDLAAGYARARRKPLVLFIHDLPHGFEPVAPWLRARQRRRDAAVYRQAAARLCVSQGMVDYFQAEFGLPGEVLLPPQSDRLPGQDPAHCRHLKQPGRLVLGYAGGLHYGYGEQLQALLPALRATGTIVELFSPVPGGRLAPLRTATDVLRFNGYLTPPEKAWQELLRRCDAVLQPYLNPPGRHALQYRTHFPSKLSDALALGLPLLLTGPAEASGLRWCDAHGACAMTVVDPDPAANVRALLRMRDDAEFRVTLARRARAAAAEFDGDKLRARLRELFGQALAA